LFDEMVLPFRSVQRLQVGLAGRHQELVVGVEVALAEQQVGGALGRHGGGRADEVQRLGVHGRDQARELRRHDLDRAAQLLADLHQQVDVEAFHAAAHLGHGVRCEGAVDAGLQRLGHGACGGSGQHGGQEELEGQYGS
jgi:hypothetical protein